MYRNYASKAEGGGIRDSAVGLRVRFSGFRVQGLGVEF